MKGFITLEKKYGITVAEDYVDFTWDDREVVYYKIYTADGCPWENGLTRRGVKAECEKCGEAFLRIKKNWNKELKRG